MKAFGREAEKVGIPLADLRRMDIPDFGITRKFSQRSKILSEEQPRRL
jgi:hypothetical protein